MDALILTTEAGAARLQGRIDKVQLIVAGRDKTIDLPAAMRMLRMEMGIEHLLCEGGPTLYGSMARAGLIRRKVCNGFAA
jgi:Pyrimidine reductase, riboflavin biosynthesis